MAGLRLRDEGGEVDRLAGEGARNWSGSASWSWPLMVASMMSRMNWPAIGAFLNWLPLVPHAMKKPCSDDLS